VGRTCSTHGGDVKYVKKIVVGDPERKDHLGDLDVNARIILKRKLRK
jgi:hypothetical protein